MATPTYYYVDYTNGVNSAGNGTGTGASAYLTLQYALDDIGTTHGGHDATNGVQINITTGNGTNETLSGTLSFTTYGTATFTVAAPLIFRGYTSTANDGGMGEIDGGGNTIVNDAAMDYLIVTDLDCHNSGANDLFTLDTGCFFTNCKLHDCGVALDLDGYQYVHGCHIYDFSVRGIEGRIFGCITHNWIESKTGTAGNSAIGINSDNGANTIAHNVVWLRGSTPTGDGIQCGQRDVVFNNTIRVENSKSTGDGINTEATTSTEISLFNNVVSGFTLGLDFNFAGVEGILFRNNLYWDNTTNKSKAVDWERDDSGESTASSDPFTNKATGDFTLVSAERAGAFYGRLDGSAVSYQDQGAIQHQDSGGAGGGLITHPGMGGGMRG